MSIIIQIINVQNINYRVKSAEFYCTWLCLLNYAQSHSIIKPGCVENILFEKDGKRDRLATTLKTQLFVRNVIKTSE